MKNKYRSIYYQLLFNIVLPVITVLLLIGIFSYNNTKTILHQNSETERNFIYDEIKSFIELQYVALSIIEEPMKKQMAVYSSELVNNIFSNTINIENADLYQIRKELGMDPRQFDIYIINNEGIVVNTTFREDLYINFFSFGKAHKDYLGQILKTGNFDSPQFFFEHKTKRYKKYSYQATTDKKYIIEIGLYSSQADHVYNYMNNHIDSIPKKKANLLAVDLFFYGDIPYPFNLKHEFIPDHLHVIPQILQGKPASLTHQKNKKEIYYTYLYIKNINPSIFSGTIVRIANDPTSQKQFIKTESIKIIIVVLISIILVYILIYFRSRAIVLPIRHLIDKTRRIANGQYSERVNEEGNNELLVLARTFNQMVTNIQERNKQIEEQSEFLYQSNRKLNEAYKLLDHQKMVIENKNDDLTASINYAQHIQESLLPDIKGFQQIFPQSFIYYMPRDIVSGDFYWYAKAGSKIIVVVSDCTGHGVPGAFMSMVGMTILHHIVNYEKVYDPAVLLSRLDTEISDLLITKNQRDHGFEGMDTAICCIDTNTHQMVFSSAQRPVIIVKDGEAITYKGSIYPIGENYDDIHKIFSNTTIDLNENDTIYLFSDGYTSQFNEENTKKFNYQRFRKLLTDLSEKQLKDQPAIIHRTFEAWRGSSHQIDDILIMGFRYQKNYKPRTISAKDIIA